MIPYIGEIRENEPLQVYSLTSKSIGNVTFTEAPGENLYLKVIFSFTFIVIWKIFVMEKIRSEIVDYSLVYNLTDPIPFTQFRKPVNLGFVSNMHACDVLFFPSFY